MFANLAGLSRISMARLLDYARERRPAGPGHVKHIKAEFLKKSALMGSRVAHFPQRIDAGEKQISVGGRLTPAADILLHLFIRIFEFKIGVPPKV